MNGDDWVKLTPGDRIRKVDEACELFNKNIPWARDEALNDETFFIIQEMAYTETCFCENCDDQVRDILIIRTDDDDDMAHKLVKEYEGSMMNMCCFCVDEIIEANKKADTKAKEARA